MAGSGKTIRWVGGILAGYAVAPLLGWAAVGLNGLVSPVDPAVAAASSGMAAAGDALLFLAVTGLAALVPTFLVARAWWRRSRT